MKQGGDYIKNIQAGPFTAFGQSKFVLSSLKTFHKKHSASPLSLKIVASGLIPTLTLLLLSSGLFAQQELNGVFSKEQPPLAETAVIYRFFNDGTFVYQCWDDVGDSFGMGWFELEKKQLTLRYETIAKIAKETRLISEENNDTCSTLRVLNPLIKTDLLIIDYQIFENDSLINQGRSDAAGFIHFNLEENQSMKIYAYSKNQFNAFNTIIIYEIQPSSASKDYILYASGLNTYTGFLESKEETYRIRVAKTGKVFKLKIGNEWVWYYEYENK